MTVAPGLDALLEVQAHDTRLDQLAHELASLPARTERDDLVAQRAATSAALAAETETRDGLARDQKRLDDEVETLDAKRTGFRDRLYGGTVTNPRELQDLQEEIEALGRRITVLEDREIEIMEQVEPVEARLADLRSNQTRQEGELAGVEARLTAAEAELAVAVDTESALRGTAAIAVPGDLLTRYEKLRTGLGGTGVARLVGNQCGGCHLGLSAMEVARLRKLDDDEVATCEECGRILVP